MENLLLRYMEESFLRSESVSGGQARPVVTISREYGCPSKLIGQMLVESVNRKSIKERSSKWRLINKEILEESARELHLPESQIKSLLDADQKGIVLDVLTFSTTYGGSARIKKTVEKVIRAFAYTGHVVIIGRGGVAFLRDHPSSLHIRLQAPLGWRIAEISRIHGVTLQQAMKTANETDAKRTRLIENLLGRKADPYLFDVSYNCMLLNKEEIVQSVLRLMEMKKMV
jgi:cytidylate kinase